ncbi:MAG TPA: lipid-A-disaccharide synthase [Candidatus Eremiobacteraeota bacterium]|nr:lipid-A-disaccharide synthase [Candidatus Eremiobacteraeota bacterium]
MGKKILIIAGEHSGDFYGAALTKNLKSLDPTLEITGIGSERMRKAGAVLLHDSSDWSAIGLLEASIKIPRLLWIFNNLKKYLRKHKQDLIVLIDFPTFNMRLARFARKSGMKSVYYFPPSAWTKKTDRALEVSSTVDKVITTFYYTREIYMKAGKEAAFFGHPIVGLLKPELSREGVMELFNISPDKKLISIFPGSRVHEINTLLPVFIESAKIISEKLSVQFAISCVSEYMEPSIRHCLERYNFHAKVVTGYPYALMNVSCFIIATSGTITLEAAYFGIPMVIGYKISPISWFIARKTLDLPPYAGLPNLILQSKVIPEFIQNDLSPDSIAEKVLHILLNHEKIKKMKEDLKEVLKKLGPSDAGEKIAEEIYSMI